MIVGISNIIQFPGDLSKGGEFEFKATFLVVILKFSQIIPP